MRDQPINPIVVVAQSQLRALIEDAVCRAVRDEVASLTQTKDKPEWWSAGRVAAETGVSKSTVARWTNTGKLPASKVGGTVRYRRSDVHALMDRGSHERR